MVVSPPAIVSPEIVTVLSSLSVASPLPRTVSASAPAPFKLRPSIASGSASAIVPRTELPKTIVSPLLASSTASRSEPSPSVSVLRTACVAARAGSPTARSRNTARTGRIIIDDSFRAAGRAATPAAPLK